MTNADFNDLEFLKSLNPIHVKFINEDMKDFKEVLRKMLIGMGIVGLSYLLLYLKNIDR